MVGFQIDGGFLKGLGCAFPDHHLDRARTHLLLQRQLPDSDQELLSNLAHQGDVGLRYWIPDPSRFEQEEPARYLPRKFTEEYLRRACCLVLDAARDAMRSAGVRPEELDCVLDASTKSIRSLGLSTTLSEMIGLRADARWKDLSGVENEGSSVLGFGRRSALQGQTVLVLSMELGSMGMLATGNDPRQRALSLLYGDGAAAAVCGSDCGSIRLDCSRSFGIDREVIDAYGVLSGSREERARGLLEMLGEEIPAIVPAFLEDCGIHARDLEHVLLFPRSGRMQDSLQEGLNLSPAQLALSRAITRRSGLLGSTAHLMALEMAQRPMLRKVEDSARVLSISMGSNCLVEFALLSVAPKVLGGIESVA